MDKISAIINVVEDELKVLPQALSLVSKIADEIIVVDMTETGASGIAKKFNARLFKHERVSYVELIRNWGISKSSGNWILILDPDEEFPERLVKKLKGIIQRPEADFYRIPRKNIVFGKWLKHSRWWPDYNIRFFKKGYVSWNEMIHGVPLTQGKGADLDEKEELAIVHHHYDTIEQFLERMNRYTSVQTKNILKTEYKFIWKDLINKPSGEFLSRYFAGEGYKDGLHGLAMALLQAFSELILYLKIWQAEKFQEQGITTQEIEKEMNSKGKETKWWLVDALIKSKNELDALPLKIYRKFFLRGM